MTISAETRRTFLKTAGAAGLALAVGRIPALSAKKNTAGRMNVLFISIDDLNDWVGCMRGYPGAKTPNLDRAAGRGVFFSNAFCSSPGCNPSRTAIMTGIRPSTSGVYKNNQPFRKSPILKNAVTLPQYFMNNGYRTIAAGKLFHDPEPSSWDNNLPTSSIRTRGTRLPPRERRPLNGIPDMDYFDWGPIDARSQDMRDWKIADWTVNKLKLQREKPFFLGCGFNGTHLPWFIPSKYFDLHPLDEIELPVVIENDLDDVPIVGQRLMPFKDNHDKVLKHDQWRKAIQAYLAAVSLVDECVGRVMDGLDSSPYRDNTAVVIWSDNGFHLGEKQYWRKGTLWDESNRCYLSISAPGTTAPGARCETPVSLDDIYPTLNDICGLPPKPELEGASLMPLLKNPDAEWERPALITLEKGNHALRTKRWHYIRYFNGSEELYDQSVDEHQWHNIAGEKKYASVIKDLRRWLPANEAPPSPEVNG